jgi:two-component system sensor histidine kinase BaeS
MELDISLEGKLIRYSLKTKLSLSYIIVILLIISVISIFSNIVLKQNFDQYIIEQLENKNLEIVKLITNNYNQKDHTWDVSFIDNVGMNALENGLIIKLRDDNNHTIWDATTHNSGLCIQMLNNMKRNMESTYKNFNGQYIEEEYSINKDGETVRIS